MKQSKTKRVRWNVSVLRPEVAQKYKCPVSNAADLSQPRFRFICRAGATLSKTASVIKHNGINHLDKCETIHLACERRRDFPGLCNGSRRFLENKLCHFKKKKKKRRILSRSCNVSCCVNPVTSYFSRGAVAKVSAEPFCGQKAITLLYKLGCAFKQLDYVRNAMA